MRSGACPRHLYCSVLPQVLPRVDPNVFDKAFLDSTAFQVWSMAKGRRGGHGPGGKGGALCREHEHIVLWVCLGGKTGGRRVCARVWGVAQGAPGSWRMRQRSLTSLAQAGAVSQGGRVGALGSVGDHGVHGAGGSGLPAALSPAGFTGGRVCGHIRQPSTTPLLWVPPPPPPLPPNTHTLVSSTTTTRPSRCRTSSASMTPSARCVWVAAGHLSAGCHCQLCAVRACMHTSVFVWLCVQAYACMNACVRGTCVCV